MLVLSLREEEYHFALSYAMWQMHGKVMWLQYLFYVALGLWFLMF